MPWNFRKSKKLMPGVRVNLSKRGPSLSVGPRGAKINIGRKGIRSTVGIPGAGISRTRKGCPFALFLLAAPIALLIGLIARLR